MEQIQIPRFTLIRTISEHSQRSFRRLAAGRDMPTP